MKLERLSMLAGISDIEGLRQAIEAMCMPEHKVRNIRLLPDSDGMEYLCFVELDAPGRNWLLIDRLGGIDYGSSVAFRIPIGRL